ncbi:allophanate hydrolase [Paenibacillus sp. HB172176]|uniref:allophanate hydrolase n=1 Tax=Paenibacillus sp. HB172176 TaxID=2493690 RepID=UPI00143C6DDB|nr:allophanate hydrolase [Paenibacillus sp. HB172176]
MTSKTSKSAIPSRTESRFPLKLTISWLRERYLAGTLQPKEVIEEILRRTAEDEAYKIWIAPPSPAALQPYLDRLEKLDKTAAPLWGIPFAIKDNIDLAGVPTTAACAEYAYTPDEHASVVERLAEAGALPLGKTNLDQFATGLVGTRSPYGETRNALKSELISGGSSSGSAVAVARGHAVFSLGTDTAGSGRVPAALNGLVGLKPSLGSWSTHGVVPACRSLDCVTVFANELADVLLIDRIVSGFDERDAWSRDIDKRPPALPQRILVPEEPLGFYGPYAEEYRQAWETAKAKARGLGIPVETIDYAPFAEAAAILYEGPWVAERWAALGQFLEANPGASVPVTETILRSGAGGHDAAALFRAFHRIQELKCEAHAELKNAVLLLPTAGGTWTRDDVTADPIRTNSAMGRYTNHCNLLDLCALAIPANEAAPDIPFGITLFAVSGEEAMLAELASDYLDRPMSKASTAAASEREPRPETLVVVCGLHMRGFPLEKQMLEHEAVFDREDETAPVYKLYQLPTNPAKPGLVRQLEGGAAIEVEVWRMPLDRFGSFASLIPAPLGIGKVTLADGSEAPGFICEGCAIEWAKDVTAAGSWKRV